MSRKSRFLCDHEQKVTYFTRFYADSLIFHAILCWKSHFLFDSVTKIAFRMRFSYKTCVFYMTLGWKSRFLRDSLLKVAFSCIFVPKVVFFMRNSRFLRNSLIKFAFSVHSSVIIHFFSLSYDENCCFFYVILGKSIFYVILCAFFKQKVAFLNDRVPKVTFFMWFCAESHFFFTLSCSESLFFSMIFWRYIYFIFCKSFMKFAFFPTIWLNSCFIRYILI